SGCSYGGIQTVLMTEANAERRLGLFAAVDFAGGAQSWGSFALRVRMIDAVKKATVPVMLIQAKNEYDAGPSDALAKELARPGKPHKMVISPPFGKSVEDGHGKFCSGEGASVWGSDVLAFLAASMKQ